MLLTQAAIINQKALNRILKQHQWIYKSDIINYNELVNHIPNGSIIDVLSNSKKFIAKALFSKNSQITLRILTYDKNEKIDINFITKRLKNALLKRLREFDFNKTTIIRLLNSEADFIPGVIVDKYDKYLVLQSLTAGSDNFIEQICDFYLKEQICEGILIKNNSNVRNLEQIPTYIKWYGKKPHQLPLHIISDDIHYLIDVENGQKTGFFIDQRLAYEVLKNNVNDKKILDCFSYIGAFSMHAFKYGAKFSTLVDISDEAISLAKETAKLNNVLYKCEFICENAFDYLNLKSKSKNSNKNLFDFIILDPPSFTKTKSSLKNALSGYKELILKSSKLLSNYGNLLSCSCSFHVSLNDFYKIHCDAFNDIKKIANLRYIGFQDTRDHPIISSMPESFYLKYFLFQIE